MNRIEDMIYNLCPEGVKYKTLGEVVNYCDGFAFKSGSFAAQGKYSVIRISDINDGAISLSEKFIEELPDNFKKEQALTGGEILVGMSGSTGKVGYNYLKEKAVVNQRIAILRNKDEILNGYLKHLLVNPDFTEYCFKNGTGPQNNIRKFVLLNYKIPVPPIQIQHKIVKLLNGFSNLSFELKSELVARKKQYEFYRDKLLDFDTEIPVKSFGELAKIVRGASPRPIQAFLTDDENGVNWIKIGDVEPGCKYITETKEKISVEGAKKSRYVKKGDFVLSNSMSFGRPYILKIDGCIHDGWLAVSDFEQYYISDFLYHLLNSTKIQDIIAQKASSGGAVQNLNADIVRSIELPVPTIETQKSIIHILDSFDAICSDQEVGLPAEIDFRQKQYEYYRNKLLNFKF